MFLTIFTPTFNRAKLLPRLYDSLIKQTDNDFEWVIVDDGSTDDTKNVIRDIISKNNCFPIVYEYRDNGGKHRAVNRGLDLARGKLFYIVDSDDMLPDTAIATIRRVESTLPEKGKWAGVAGLKGCISSNDAIGSTFKNRDHVDATSVERDKYRIIGDKAEVVYTDVFRRFKFPEFENERFLTENAVWYAIADAGYKFRWFNQIIYRGEYLEGGLTDNYERLRKENPRGYLYVYALRYKTVKGIRKKLASALNYKIIAQSIEMSNKQMREDSGISGLAFALATAYNIIFRKVK